ncbi:MAG TPA: ATP-grasp domain-containing protein [Bdellovibrionota bacterium]|jgi:biotin carboxylase
MSRPIVIVDPLSSGVELAPAFKERGIPCVAVKTFEPQSSLGYGTRLQTEDFVEVIPKRPDLEEVLRKLNPLAILPGTDAAIAMAERLSAAITPNFSNDPKKSSHRLHKALMQQALMEAGVPALGTISSSDENEVAAWILERALSDSPLIVKPANSAGSDKVFHIPAGEDWQQAFRRVLTEPSKLTGERNETAVVQEQAIGTEFAVGTVSAKGKHYLAHLIRYNKLSLEDRKTVYDFVEFLPFTAETLGPLFEYAQNALDALGIRWGAAHIEIMLTKNGPRLIEASPRMCGGPVVLFAREASGSSQADKLVEIFADGDVTTKNLNFKKTVMPVFLKANATGFVSNVSALDGVNQLPTIFKKFVWFKEGDRLQQTVDYLSSIGIVALSGEREKILLDYKKIREMESQLRIQEVK